MQDTLSSFQGAIGLIALIGGLFFHRPGGAAVYGAIIGGLCAAFFMLALTSFGGSLNSYLAGRIIGGPIFGCVLIALLGHYIRRGFGAMFGRSKPPAAPTEDSFKAN